MITSVKEVIGTAVTITDYLFIISLSVIQVRSFHVGIADTFYLVSEFPIHFQEFSNFGDL